MNAFNQTPSGGNPSAGEAAGDRRGFIVQAAALFSAAGSLLVPAIAGAVAFLNPLRQKSRAGQLMRLTSLAVLPEDGTPRKFSVIADRTDAWTRYPNEPIGAVYLRRVAKNKVEAIQVVCPHAGCSIQYDASPDGGKFFCPCHGASFDLDGKRLDETSPCPRDLDTLEVKIENGTEVWVKFQNFGTGIAKKVAKA